jgi:phosphate transport system protein
MFREILAILRREDLLKQAMEEAEEMLSKAELMFRTAMDMIMECRRPDIDIYERDREINRMEWEVRRKVLEHLVVGNRKEDVAAALILTSAVVDIERIGDYSKNIFELADICPRDVVVEEDHAKFFREIESQILGIFSLTRDAYKEANSQKAQTAMDMHWRISERCDRMFEHLASEPGLHPEYAVIYTLLSRYLKRVSSHLKNIASSVVNPFPRMGFRSSAEGKDLDVG